MAVKVAIIGCGAVTELYYGPALAELERSREVSVRGLFDPNEKQTAKLSAQFPKAEVLTDLGALSKDKFDLAIIASPPVFHPDQATKAMRAGLAVLCEKPLASTVYDIQQMVATSKEVNRLLAVGHYRRFLPAAGAIKEIVQNKTFGAVRSFKYQEGVRFNWPAQSASFFNRAQTAGGVLLDLGVHILDLLCWWFGEPEATDYFDDAMGGLEANCLLKMRFLGAPGSSPAQVFEGTMRCSRDWDMRNACVIEFENAVLEWNPGDAVGFNVRMRGSNSVLKNVVDNGTGAKTHQHAFLLQLKAVVDMVGAGEDPGAPRSGAGEDACAPVVRASEALAPLRVIEECYRHRELIEMPWLTEAEKAGIR